MYVPRIASSAHPPFLHPQHRLPDGVVADHFRDGGVGVLPDLNRHAGYRNPDIGPISDEEFQDGFRFAYQAVVDFRLHHVVNLDGAAYGWGSD